MKGGQEDGRWWNLGSEAGVGEAGYGGAEIKNLVEIAGLGMA